MPRLNEFFKAKILDRKFSKFGEGHRLDEADLSTQYVPTPSTSTARVPVAQQSKAAEAATERLNKRFKKPATAAYREVKRELEAQNLQEKQALDLQQRLTRQPVVVERPSSLSVVLFWCPDLLGESVIGPRNEVDKAIHQCLVTESNTNPTEAATLLLSRGIQLTRPPPPSEDISVCEQPTAGEWREKQKQNFVRILDNLIRDHKKETFRRLRANNRLVQTLLSIDGATEFLSACKFSANQLPSNPPPTSTQENSPSSVEGQKTSPELEVYWTISEEDARCTQHLEKMRDLLLTADPILPKLYRDTKVFQVTDNVPVSLTRDQLPDEFFCLSKDEVKGLIERQQKVIAESGMLLTKSMRKQLKVQNVMMFRYALLRIRLPGNQIIQGTFYAKDSMSTVRCWVSDCLADPTIQFQLWSPPGLVCPSKPNLPPSARFELTEDTESITDLGLAPSSLLILVLSGDQPSATTAAGPERLLRQDLIAKLTAMAPPL